MTGYVTPTTWEQCARHVEAGGIVEVQTAWGAWEREYLTPRTYRRRHGAPGGSAWVTRRLVPIESPAAPVPPWPGAVLSGLTDEDGQPTWLAHAGQVRGEQVRRRSDVVWVNNDQMVAYLDTVWVEVRAPRAVTLPETERVPWWEAKDRLGLAGDPFVEVGSGDEGPWVRVVEGGTKLYSPVAPDGTVKVLKDGDR